MADLIYIYIIYMEVRRSLLYRDNGERYDAEVKHLVLVSLVFYFLSCLNTVEITIYRVGERERRVKI